MRPLRLGTRGSALARRQAAIAQAALERPHPGCRVALEVITAKADEHPELPLTAFGGEGIFVRELETALLEGRIDLAVHSAKDLPLELPTRLCLAALLERGEARDALVSRSGEPFDRLPAGSTIGTSSARRRSQLLHRRADLRFLEIRGNVDTRLRRLDEGRYDAIVLAACGLQRLGLEGRITELLDLDLLVPEPGQGALALEARRDDPEILDAARALDHATTRACVEAERAFLRALGGGCRVPIAAHAGCTEEHLVLTGAVLSPDGSEALRSTLDGPMTEPVALGDRLAAQLTARGARNLLRGGGQGSPAESRDHPIDSSSGRPIGGNLGSPL